MRLHPREIRLQVELYNAHSLKIPFELVRLSQITVSIGVDYDSDLVLRIDKAGNRPTSAVEENGTI